MNIQIKNHINANSEKWLVTLLTGFSLFFVLFIYQGYNIQAGVSYSGHSLLFRASAFGFLTSLTFFINEFYLSNLFSPTNLKRKSGWVIWEVFTGANVTFLLFNYFWNWTEMDWKGYFLMIFEYTCVVTFPILFVRALVKKPQHMPVEPDRLLFKSENGKHQLRIKPENLLYIASADNYVEIFYISDGKIKCELQRNSLKTIEMDYPESSHLLRCHRRYIINPNKINQIITANRQIQLDLGYSTIIPVSQKYHAKFNRNSPLTHSPHISKFHPKPS